MRRILLATAVLLAIATSARAQVGPGPAPTRPPAIGGIGTPSPGIGTGFSPYLNLNRGGNSAAQNLYGIVRPQMSMQQSIQALQQQQATLAGGTPGQDDALTAQGIVVGTRVRFLNTGGYFQNLAGGTSAAAAPGTGFAFTRPPAGTMGLTPGLGTGTTPRGRVR